MTFRGFPAESMRWFESMLGVDSWPTVAARRAEHEQSVRLPMMRLCAELADDYGPAYVWKLHRDRWIWSHQVAAFDVADTIGVTITLSLDDLQVAGGWLRSSSDQVRRYRAAVAGPAGNTLARVVGGLPAKGYEVGGDTLVRPPPGAPADAARAQLLRHRTLVASRAWPAGRWLHTPAVVARVRRAGGELWPLVAWLAEWVGPRA